MAELLYRAQMLSSVPVCTLAQALGVPVPEHTLRAKGWLGALIELALGADPKAGSLPDFPHLGVELKTLPVDKQGRSIESTFCCAIDMLQAQYEEWETSRLKQRLSRVLFIPIQVSGKRSDLTVRVIQSPYLWEPDAPQWQILQQDWEWLMGKIGAGVTAQISAFEGEYLQLRPKAAKASQRTWGADACYGIQRVQPMGFYLRARFTTALIQTPKQSLNSAAKTDMLDDLKRAFD
jgi:DNA mismatch repair protein MutH